MALPKAQCQNKEKAELRPDKAYPYRIARTRLRWSVTMQIPLASAPVFAVIGAGLRVMGFGRDKPTLC